MDRPRILLADDHRMVAQGLQSLLSESFELVGTAADGREMVALTRALRPDAVVADVSMPVLNGLDAITQLVAEGVSSKFLVLTMHAERQIALAALRAGASAYILKQSAGEELVEAIRAVLDGQVYVTPLLGEDPKSLLSEARSPGWTAGLTPRRREVLRLIAEGKTMKEIGIALQVSTRTVESHKYELMRAIGARTTADLIQYAVRIGLTAG